MHNISIKCQTLVDEASQEAIARSYQASTEMRNAAINILRGQRSGRRYRVPYTGPGQTVSANGKIRRRKPRYYTASAPGEAPANRTGAYRLSYKPTPYAIRRGNNLHVFAAISSDTKTKDGKLIGAILEYGTEDGRIAPRPHKKIIQDRAKQRIVRIYSRPYLRR